HRVQHGVTALNVRHPSRHNFGPADTFGIRHRAVATIQRVPRMQTLRVSYGQTVVAHRALLRFNSSFASRRASLSLAPVSIAMATRSAHQYGTRLPSIVTSSSPCACSFASAIATLV